MRTRPRRTKRAVATGGEDARTRDRLLEVAGETFAERGFRLTTIREVVKRARVNIASVHYHFGSKNDLYLAALREALARAAPAAGTPVPRPDAPRFLATFIASAVERLLSPRPEWHQRLLQREFVEPSFALDVVVREYIRPNFKVLREGIAALLPGAADRDVDLHALSVIGQIIYYRAAAAVAQRLLGVKGFDAAFCEALAAHVTRFSARALGVKP